MKIEQSQKIAMTPELIQAIQVLQFNNQELNEYIKNELLENPLLEYEAEGTADPHIADIDFDRIREIAADSDYSSDSLEQWEKGKSEGEFSYNPVKYNEYSLLDYLRQQLGFLTIEEDEAEIVDFLIQNVDRDGYLEISLEDAVNALGCRLGDCEKALGILQSMDPPGIGARSLEECLALQLKDKGLWCDSMDQILKVHLENLAFNKIKVISGDLGIKEEEVQKIFDTIKTLNPKPGNSFDEESQIRYVIPDVVVEKDGDEFKVSLYEFGNPRLILSSYYDTIKDKLKEDPELKEYMNERTGKALRLIKAIEQRRETILSVAGEIVKHQKEYFEKGEKYIKPLTLKDIADKLGIHESTVSRTVNGKYMQTCRGLLEMKFFFGGGLTSQDGSGISNTSIKKMIKEIIDSENPLKPYSDQKLVELLTENGVEISRRTVTKYREMMGIGSSSMRKRF